MGAPGPSLEGNDHLVGQGFREDLRENRHQRHRWCRPRNEGMLFFLATLIGGAAAQNVLVVYAQDPYGQTQQLAESIGAGAAGAQVKILPVESVNYKRDVAEWADALFLGSGVYNGNAKPELLAFINSFDFEDDLSGARATRRDASCCCCSTKANLQSSRLAGMLGGSFATGGAAGAGLQPVIEQLNRALMGFRVMVVGGDSWQNGEGTAVVTNNSAPLDASALELGRAHGARMARQAAAMRRGAASPPPPPGPSGGGGGGGKGMPPRWGDLWEAKISANLTQVGYDAGLVIVNFSTACGDEPAKQKMKTVYGDFYTVLTRCDLGYEFTIAPASRGGACTHRRIGLDVDGRICQVRRRAPLVLPAAPRHLPHRARPSPPRCRVPRAVPCDRRAAAPSARATPTARTRTASTPTRRRSGSRRRPSPSAASRSSCGAASPPPPTRRAAPPTTPSRRRSPSAATARPSTST